MNGYGNSVFLRTAFEVSSGVAPVNTVAPAITGTAQEGETVTCSTGTWTGTPTITYAYQWKRNGSNIGSATSSTYVLVTADVSQSITCQVTATNGSGSASATSNTITPIAAVDPDAQAFITAAAITDPTQQAAINTLVIDLKGYSIWSKLGTIYPFVGGTATTHKFNLKNPLNTDAAFRLVFNGGWTHSSTGATPNGTNAYADTKFNINNFASTSNLSIGVYLRTNSALGGYDFGQGYADFAIEGVVLWSRGATNQLFYSAIGNTTVSTLTNTNSRGFYAITRGNTTQQNLHIRVSQTVNDTQSRSIVNNYATKNIFLGAINNQPLILASNPAFFSNREQSFAFMADFLTQSEIDNLSTAVQAFQTTLGRQV
jgi:hypothetical protein